MSTRSRIAIQLPTGEIQSIYCHWDWWEYTQNILVKYWQDCEETKKLIATGEISSLGATMKKRKWNAKNPKKNNDGIYIETLFYNRKEDEKTNPITHTNEKEFIKEYKDNIYIEYAHIGTKTDTGIDWRMITL